MREFFIQITDEVIDGELTAKTTPSVIDKVGIAGEHNASRLIFCLPDTWEASWEYHVECVNSSGEGAKSDTLTVTKLDGKNTIVFDIPRGMTRAGSGNYTLEGTKRNGDDVVSVFRSATVDLYFKNSPRLGKRIIDAIEDVLSGLFAKINNLVDRFNDGEFNGKNGEKGDKGDKGDRGEQGETGAKGDNALINGYNTVTLQSGNNLRVLQNGNVITLDVDNIPLYHTLPETAEYGDVCLYAVPNEIDTTHSGKTIVFDWDGFLKAQNDSSTFEMTFHKDGAELGYINASYTFSDDMTYTENTLYIMFENEEWQICFINGILEAQYSYHKLNGAAMQISEPPTAYTLPEFDKVECNFENITDTIFYSSLELMYYLGEWHKTCDNSSQGVENCIPAVHTLPSEAADGDMCLYSPANTIELCDNGKRIYFDWEEFAKPVSEQSRVSYNIRPPDYQGSLIIDCQTSANGNNVTIQKSTPNPTTQVLLRVVFSNGTFSQGILQTTIAGVAEKTEFTSVDDLPKYFDLFEFNEIANKQIIGTATAFYAPYRLMVYRAGEWQRVETLLDIPTGIDSYIPADKIELTTETATLEPNTHYSFGEVATLTLEFAEGDAAKVNEYMFSFTSGETATVLTLPSSVQWANELTVEANKRYEISVVDNIGLWCAVEVSE